MGLKINGSTSGSIEIDVPAVAGTNTAITIPATSGGEFIVSDSSGNVDLGALDISGSAAADSVNIDAGGRLLIGTSSEIVSSTPSASVHMVDTGGGKIYMMRDSATVAAGSDLGMIRFYSNDGGAEESVRIEAEADAAHAAGDKPGRLVFRTSESGSSSPTERVKIEANGNFQFNNVSSAVFPGTDNSYTLGANGVRWSAVWAANGSIQTSDERQKTEITDSVLGTDFIKSLRPVSYKWINGGNVDTGERDEDNNYIYAPSPGKRRHWGFIAQEVKQSVDAAGVDFGGWLLTDKDDPDSEQALRYDQFIAPLTKALQEALAKIETLETANASLEARLTALEGGAS